MLKDFIELSIEYLQLGKWKCIYVYDMDLLNLINLSQNAYILIIQSIFYMEYMTVIMQKFEKIVKTYKFHLLSMKISAEIIMKRELRIFLNLCLN